MSDLGIARRIAGGDQEQFTALIRQYNRRLYRLARATLRDDAEAEDALQDAYLCAYHGIQDFRGDAAISTWLSRLVLNECLSRIRRGNRRSKVVPLVSSNDEVGLVAEEPAGRPERIVARAQMRGLLEQKLDELPEAFRVVFVLRSVEELSVEETAEVLGVPAATVRTRYFRARGLLREALAQEIDLAERDLFEFGGSRCDRICARVLERLASLNPPATV
jgi:RNA polymerase sigma factor (sigma-70 family)